MFRGTKLPSWSALRRLRNECAGHPAKATGPRDAPTRRTFMGRGFGDYNSIKYEQWSPRDEVAHPTAELGRLLDAYAVDAAAKVEEAWRETCEEAHAV